MNIKTIPVPWCDGTWHDVPLPAVPVECTSVLLEQAIAAFNQNLARHLEEGREGQYVAYRGNVCLGFSTSKNLLIAEHRSAYRRKEVFVGKITSHADEPLSFNRF